MSFLNFNYQSYFLHALLLYSKIITHAYQYSKIIYNIPLIKMGIDYIHRIYIIIYNTVYKIRVEPDANYWINISFIEKVDYDFFSFMNKMGMVDSMFQLPVLLSQSFDNVIKHYKTYNYVDNYSFLNKENHNLIKEYISYDGFLKKNSSVETLLIMKYDDIYKFKCFTSKAQFFKEIDKIHSPMKRTKSVSFDNTEQNTPQLEVTMPFIQSNVSFITIEYSIPDDSRDSITFKLSRSVFIVGNEILSAVFVMRFLEYTVGAGRYDPNYILNILDGNIKLFKMQSHQYCLLEKDNYRIIDL